MSDCDMNCLGGGGGGGGQVGTGDNAVHLRVLVGN